MSDDLDSPTKTDNPESPPSDNAAPRVSANTDELPHNPESSPEEDSAELDKLEVRK